MKTYELTYIVSSQTGLEKADAFVKEVEAFIQSKNGVIVKSQKSTAQTLAYPIKKQGSGFFATVEFHAEENTIKEVKEKLTKDAQVLRTMLVVKKPVKIVKERRTRKPLFTSGASLPESQSVFKGAAEPKQKEVSPEDLNKKLDELLNE